MNLRVVHYQTGLCQFSVQFKHNMAKTELFIHHPLKCALPRLCLHSKWHLHSPSGSGLNLAPYLNFASHPQPIHQQVVLILSSKNINLCTFLYVHSSSLISTTTVASLKAFLRPLLSLVGSHRAAGRVCLQCQ